MGWLDPLDFVIGAVGLLIAVITLIRVQSVHRAQAEERALLRRLYGTETLAGHLRSAAVLLRQGENEARVLAEELLRLCGQIEGISRVLDSMDAHRTASGRQAVRLVEQGYYVPSFYSHVVDNAQSSADFLMYRNLQISNVDILESMERATKRGVRIRILAISSEAEDAVLEQASMVLPWPQVPPSTLRRQLSDAESQLKSVVQEWDERARQQFEYRGYTIAPNMHFARMDGLVMQGFVGTLSSAQPEQLGDRGYLEIPRNSEPGTTLARHFEELWQRSASTTLVGG